MNFRIKARLGRGQMDLDGNKLVLVPTHEGWIELIRIPPTEN